MWTWLIFREAYVSYKVYRYYYGQPNNSKNILLKNTLLSVYDFLPHGEQCISRLEKYKKSLIIQINAQEDDYNQCYMRFIDISDDIERANCTFQDFDNHF